MTFSHARPITFVLAAMALVAFAPHASAETSTLKMKFVYDGDAPAQEAIDVTRDVAFCGKHDLKDETLIVDPSTKAIQNVVVYVYTRGSNLPPQSPRNATHVLANDKCRFEPRIVVAQTGDSLKITNPDEVGHNANLNFFRNAAQNLMIPSSQEKVVALEEAEPAPIPVDCNIHPWMRAYVVVLEHPFAAVSDAAGEITIEGLPAGEELTFRVYHEKGKIDEVTVDGKDEDWRRSRFEVTLAPGITDMGTIAVPADAFD